MAKTKLPKEQLCWVWRVILKFISGLLDRTKPYGPGTFEPIARVSVSVTWQPIWLRMIDGQLCVWLRKRGSNEVYANMCSAPSRAMLPVGGFDEVKRRICKEFYADKPFTSEQWVGNYDPTDQRGTFVHHVYLVDCDPNFHGDPSTGGAWYSINRLPDVVAQHIPFIEDAASLFRTR